MLVELLTISIKGAGVGVGTVGERCRCRTVQSRGPGNTYRDVTYLQLGSMHIRVAVSLRKTYYRYT